LALEYGFGYVVSEVGNKPQIFLCNKNRQNEHIIPIIVSSACFEHPSVHPQEDFYMQFYGISFMHPYKQSGRWH